MPNSELIKADVKQNLRRSLCQKRGARLFVLYFRVTYESYGYVPTFIGTYIFNSFGISLLKNNFFMVNMCLRITLLISVFNIYQFQITRYFQIFQNTRTCARFQLDIHILLYLKQVLLCHTLLNNTFYWAFSFYFIMQKFLKNGFYTYGVHRSGTTRTTTY